MSRLEVSWGFALRHAAPRAVAALASIACVLAALARFQGNEGTPAAPTPSTPPAVALARPPAVDPNAEERAARIQREALAEAAGLARLGAHEAALAVLDRVLGTLPGALRAEVVLERERVWAASAQAAADLPPPPVGPLARVKTVPAVPVPAAASEAASPESGNTQQSPVTPVRPRRVAPRIKVLDALPKPLAAVAGPSVFQQDVERAIADGVLFLQQPFRAKRAGETALVAFALLRSGVSPQHPVVERAFKDLESQTITWTYDLAVAIMAYEALGIERTSASRGGTKPRYQRKRLPAGAMKQINRLASRLVSGRTAKGDWGYECRSGSRPGRNAIGHTDNSNTQFAVLGLHAAERAGFKVPTTCWRAVVGHFLETQAEPSPCKPYAVAYGGARSALFNPAAKGGTRSLRAGSQASSRSGWGYRRGEPPTHSMTAAGLSSLVIAGNALCVRGELASKQTERVREASLRGLMAIAAEIQPALSVRGRWSYYALYSLEKAMDVNSVLRLNNVDWWEVSATSLVQRQGRNGGWGGVVDTSLALLVLNRATLSLAGPGTRVRGTAGPRPKPAANPLAVKVGRQQVFLLFTLRELKDHKAPRKTLKLARRAIKAVPESALPQLVAPLAPLLSSTSKATQRFARAQLKAITGQDLDEAGYQDWGMSYRRLEGDPRSPRTAAAARWALTQASDPLIQQGARVCLRGQLVGAVPDLVAALGRAHGEAHQEACTALRILTGVDPGEGFTDRRKTTHAWRQWLEELGNVDRWVQVRTFAWGGQGARAAYALLKPMGEAVVPELLAAYDERPDADWIAALLAELTGLDAEASPVAWREAWSTRAGD